MKKIKLSSYFLRTKWFVILVIAIVLIIFGRTVDSPALTKTAIVLGCGIDYSKEQSEFIVTTQSINMASSSMESSGQTTYETYTCNGKTISSALDDISRKMGLTMSLSHCNVLFVSDSALKLDILQLIHPLTRMYSLPEHAVVVTADRSPKDMLALQIGTTISSPYYLQLALTNKEGTDAMIRTTIKDLMARTLSRSKATAIPYVTATLMTDQPADSTTRYEERYELDLKQALVFNKTDTHILDKKPSEVLALYISQSAYGAVNYVFEDGGTVDFSILEKSVETKAKGRNIEATIDLTVELLDVQFIPTDKVLTGADEVILQAAENLGKELSERLVELFELSKELNIDFLGLQAKAYQSVGRHLEDDCLKTLSFHPTVKLSVKETS